MIVTRSWLNEWIDLDGISTDELCKTFNSIGLEVDRVKSYDVPKNIVFGKVLECKKHPNADKLNLCQVDVGGSEVLQIVCGASNVRAGLDVVVATVGAVMPNGMKIKPVKLRGVDSFGMICSAKEIGLEDFSDGIVELDSSIGKFKLGQEVRENRYFNDDLIEIELTANRGDCLSIHGVCRDLSAAFNRPIREYNTFKDEATKGVGRVLTISHESLFDVHLSYKALKLKDLTTSMLVKLRLTQIDEEVNSVIDSLLVYATHATGVILRAYNHEFFAQDGKDVAKIKLEKDENGYACIFG
jgi:phenylalanyl-tRNA synthetase beta chain